MKRREFITFLGGAVAAWAIGARAQQSAAPVIGFLSSRSPRESAHLVTAFRQGLRDLGYTDGENVQIEYRWAENQTDRLPALAAELVGRPASVIAATGGMVSAQVAKAATLSIPVVFIVGDDPVDGGLVDRLNRPGGNLTGMSLSIAALGAKRLELLRRLIPSVTMIGILVNPNYSSSDQQLSDLQVAARAYGLQIDVQRASNEQEIETAFAILAEHHVGALVIASNPLFESRRNQVVALAARYLLPAIYSLREYTAAGGLMSYGSIISDMYWQAGIYTGRILKGEKPAELPVMQPTKFELLINLKTANALGLEIPPTLLALADEVIE